VPCDDGNPLTVDDKCLNMKCLGTVSQDVLETPDGVRSFEVTMRVKDRRPEVLSPVVWVTYSRVWGAAPWDTNTTASPGLKLLAESGHTSVLEAELAAKKAAGTITSYGVATSTEQFTTDHTVGQEFSFKVVAGMNDQLVFASMLYRTNDRFVAPLEGGIPFFTGLHGMKPNYGEQKDFTLWDAGTEINDPYFANLEIGYQSTQPGTKWMPVTAGHSHGIPENGTILMVPDWEMSPVALNNDTFPRPTDFMQITFSPSMEVLLGDQVRAQRGVDLLVEFTLEQGQNIGNEIHVVLPEEFSLDEGALTTANVTWWGFQRYINQNWAHHNDGPSNADRATLRSDGKAMYDDPMYDQPPFTVVDHQTRTVMVRWAEGMQIQPKHTQTVYLTIHHVRNPNNCKMRTFSLSTHQCYTHDLHGAGTQLIRRCSAPLYSATSIRSTSAVPAHCNMCNACIFMYDNLATGNSVFECEENNQKFIRQRPTGFAHFGKYFDQGTIWDLGCKVVYDN